MEEKNDRKINYRELQSMAKRLHLPGNLKYHLLLEIIDARKSGKEYIVNRILTEQKLERVRRKKEKIEAREAAYQHLKISQDRKQSSKLRKSICHAPPLPDSSTVPSWPSPNTFHANNIRSLLSMPVESFQELLRKSKEQEILKSQDHSSERRYYYSDYQESLSQRVLFPNQNFFQDTYQPMREDDSVLRDEFLVENPARSAFPCIPPFPQRPDYPDSAPIEQQSKKASFQMKDILGQSDPNWGINYGQSYCMGGTYEGNQPGGDVSSMPPYLPEPYLSHYPPYLPSSDHWRNVNEINQDNYNWRYLEYSGFQGVSGSSGEAASSPNSDTVSATDEDLPKESASAPDTATYNVIPLPVQQNYYTLPSEQNAGFQDSSYVTELPTVLEESQLSEHSLPPDRDVCVLSVIDHQEWTCEFTSEIQSNFIHSVSSHSYLELN